MIYCRADRPHHPRQHARRAGAGLHPHRPGQGPWRTSKVLIGHALKNAAVPIVTIIGIGVALLISGVVVTETVFAIPGLGRLTVDAILRRDYPIIQGIILIFSAAYVLVNLLVDLSYTLSRPAHPVLRRGAMTVAPSRSSPLADRAAARRSAARWRYVRRHPTIVVGGVLLLVMMADGGVRALSRHRRPAGVVADPPAALAVGAILVRHRHARPRRLQPHDLRRARVADRRHQRRAAQRPRSASRSASSPASPAGSTRSSCGSWTG